MQLSEYQNKSRRTWITNHNHDEIRAVLGLVGESGEIAEKFKKHLRGDYVLVKEDIAKELGDVLYYLARIADNFKLSLNEVGNLNIKKLLDRQKRGVIKGTGDNR